jgi:murein DD-endopeptidase MepM/ murein hydrolase activator NlpD
MLPAPKIRLGNITAKWRYSSGAGHFAYDYAMPTGTPLYATGAGLIKASNDGVLDKTPGRPGNLPGQPGSGSPSNWVLLETLDPKGRKVTILYQHLSDTLVKTGQRVRAGQIIGKSGQTGNATGPHLHIAAMKGWGYTAATRYAYMANQGKNTHIIYPPTLAWSEAAPRPVPVVRVRDVQPLKRNTSVALVQRTLIRLGYRIPSIQSGKVKPGTFGAETKAAYAAYQRRLGYKGRAANGVPGLASLTALGKRGGFRVTK